jgi:ABC-type glycerol-3-phosphate transport system permease component
MIPVSKGGLTIAVIPSIAVFALFQEQVVSSLIAGLSRDR